MWPECRPNWAGNLDKLTRTKAAKLQVLVGANVSFEEFRKVSGVATIAAATAQLNARLAARGALSDSGARCLRHARDHARSVDRPQTNQPEQYSCACVRLPGWPEVL